MTAAVLGFKIDSSQAPSAAVDLEKLYAAATKMEAAADSLEATFKGLNTALGQTGQGAEKAKTETDRVGRSFQQQDDHVRAFRMELERLTMKYQPLAQATKSYEASVAEINRAHQLGVINADQMRRALEQERMAFERLKTSATTASAAVQAANNNNRPNLQGFNAANAGYQFQDIAVTAAMGMNPLMIGLQQGTQLASVVGSMERPVAGLAAAFTSLISPVSLVTIGLTAGAAALIQYGSAWFSGGADDISGNLEAQNELIARVAERWGQATPALKAYADQLERAREVSEVEQAVTVRSGQEYEKIATQLTTFSDRYSDFVSVLTAASNATGSQRTEISELGTAYVTLQERIAANKATVEDFDRVRSAATRAMAMEGADELDIFKSGMDELTASTAKAREELQKLQIDRAIALNSEHPSRGTYGGLVRDPNGRIQGDSFPLPESGPTIQRRPSDLDRAPDGDAAYVMNSDGRLVPVPIPGRRPNYFEREAEAPSFRQFRANRNTAWDRSIIEEELRRREMGEVFKGFFTDFGAELRRNGGDLGKALMESLSSAAMEAASQAWEKVGNMAANFLVNAVMGQPSTGLLHKTIGFTGANTTLGEILGAGTSLPANDNVAGGFSGLSAVTGGMSSMAAYRDAIASIESRGSGGYSALGPWTRGDRAYGRYQIMGNNIGPWSEAALGRRIGASEFMASPSLQDQIFDHRFGSYVDKFGPAGAAQAWFGGPGSVGKGAGWTDVLGTSGSAYVEKFNKALGGATENLSGFGQGLGQIGQAMSTSFFPAAPAASGGGGGFFGWLGGLFGGGSQWNLAKSGAITGLFANGTNYAPGGLAVVGEKGPELVNLPAGSQVFDTNRSARMMGGNDKGGGNQRPQINVYVQGANSDEQIREMSRQGAQEAIYQYNQNQERGGFGDNQQKFNARKG